MLVSGGREPFWDGSDIRAIKNTLKKEVADNSEVASDQNFNKIQYFNQTLYFNKIQFSFVIIREYILNFQVSFAHPEFSGVSAEAKDFIRSKKLERFLFWWFRNNFLLEWCVRSFISGLLEKQQSRRMTGNQCLGHSWIRQAMSDNIQYM